MLFFQNEVPETENDEFSRYFKGKTIFSCKSAYCFHSHKILESNIKVSTLYCFLQKPQMYHEYTLTQDILLSYLYIKVLVVGTPLCGVISNLLHPNLALNAGTREKIFSFNS